MGAPFPSVLTASGTHLVDSSANVMPVLKGFSIQPGSTYWPLATYQAIYAKGARIMRMVVFWDLLEPASGNISTSYISYLDANIANCVSAGMYVILNLYFGPGGVHMPSWAVTVNTSTPSSMANYAANGQNATQYLAKRYGDPSDPLGAGQYTKGVTGFQCNEPTPDDTTVSSWVTTLMSQQATMISWFRAYAPSWIGFVSSGWAEAALVANATGSGQTAQTFTSASATAFTAAGGNVVVDLHDALWATTTTASQPDFDSRQANGTPDNSAEISEGETAYLAYPPAVSGTQLTRAQCQQVHVAWLATYMAYCQSSYADCPLMIGEANWKPYDGTNTWTGGSALITDKLATWADSAVPPCIIMEWDYNTDQASDPFSVNPGTGAVGVNSDGWLSYTDTLLAASPGGTIDVSSADAARVREAAWSHGGDFAAAAESQQVRVLLGSGDSAAAAQAAAVRAMPGSGDSAAGMQAAAARAELAGADAASSAQASAVRAGAADAASGVQASALQVTVPGHDAASGVQAGQLRLTSGDSASAALAASAVRVTLASADAAGGTQSGAVRAGAVSADWAGGAQVAAVRAAAGSADGGAAAQSVLAGRAVLASADAAAAVQAPAVRAVLAGADAGSAAQAAMLKTSSADTAGGTQAAAVRAALAGADADSGVQAAQLRLAGADSGSAAQAAGLKIASAGWASAVLAQQVRAGLAGADAVSGVQSGSVHLSSVTVSSADAAGGVQSGQVTARPGSADAGTAADRPLRAWRAGADSAAAGQSGGVRVTLAGADASGGVQAGQVTARLSQADAGSAGQAQLIRASTADTAGGAQASAVRAELAGTDTAGGAQSGSVTAAGQRVSSADSVSAAQGAAVRVSLPGGDFTAAGSTAQVSARPGSADTFSAQAAGSAGSRLAGADTASGGSMPAGLAVLSADAGSAVSGQQVTARAGSGDFAAAAMSGAVQGSGSRVSSADAGLVTESAFCYRAGADGTARGAEAAAVRLRAAERGSVSAVPLSAWPSAADTSAARTAPSSGWPASADSAGAAEKHLPFRFAGTDGAVTVEVVHETGIWTSVPVNVRLQNRFWLVTGMDEQGAEVVLLAAEHLSGDVLAAAARAAAGPVRRVSCGDAAWSCSAPPAPVIAVTCWVVPAVQVTVRLHPAGQRLEAACG